MKEALKTSILAIESIEEWREANELMARMLTHLKSVAVTAFKPGDKVYFISSKTGKKISGTVIKVNSVAVKVSTETDGNWRVAGTFLHKEK